jgi:hypothetical protein
MSKLLSKASTKRQQISLSSYGFPTFEEKMFYANYVNEIVGDKFKVKDITSFVSLSRNSVEISIKTCKTLKLVPEHEVINSYKKLNSMLEICKNNDKYILTMFKEITNWHFFDKNMVSLNSGDNRDMSMYKLIIFYKDRFLNFGNLDRSQETLNNFKVKLNKFIENNLEAECIICMENIPESELICKCDKCGEEYCKTCYNNFINHNEFKCPHCTQTIHFKSIKMSLK